MSEGTEFEVFDTVQGALSTCTGERWEQLLVRHLGRTLDRGSALSVSVGLPDAAAFRARIRSGTLGNLRYWHQEADAHVARIRDAADPGAERQILIVQLSGASWLTVAGHRERLCPGDMAFVRHVDEVRFEHEGRIEQLVLMLQLEEAMLPECVRPFRLDGALGKLAFRWVRDGCLAATSIPVHLAAGLAQMLSRLVAQALVMHPRPIEARADGAITVRAIEEYIERRLSDPCLSLGHIAQAFGCSVRTLHRAFSRSGKPSLGRYVWRKRVEAGAALLRAPAMASRTLTDIALELGFSSSAHFSTLFREAFDMTPSEYRRSFLGATLTNRVAGMDLHGLPQAA